ncbi:hypothetical protein ZOSMA_125G00380 [Zostera marina]|uniref:Uncharacterized protein n=1 Tax=Zostera marina TaxID=29655 RepID=A0A0K9Q293_ZOSMR|nr:hypothetical protein ZOSMA_125G00380 [Zostera marina]
MGRAPCCDKANVKKGPWSPEEDFKLKTYIEEHGTGGNWIALPRKIGIKRCGKSCRLRWLNYLRPNIKHGGFSEEEDNIICSLYISIGSRWSIIAAQLPGRTDNDIKNYWNTRLKKKLLPAGKRKDSSMALQMMRGRSNSKDEKKDGGGFSASAIDRMQLHMQLQGFNNDTCFSFYNRPTAGAEAGTVVGGGVPSIVNASVHHHDQMELNTAVTTKTDEDGDDKNNIDQPLSTNNHHDFDDRYSLHAAGYSSSQASNIQKIEGLQYDDLSEFIFGLNSSSSSNRFLEVQEGKQEVVNQDLDFFREMEQESFLLDYNLGTTYIYD